MARPEAARGHCLTDQQTFVFQARRRICDTGEGNVRLLGYVEQRVRSVAQIQDPKHSHILFRGIRIGVDARVKPPPSEARARISDWC